MTTVKRDALIRTMLKNLDHTLNKLSHVDGRNEILPSCDSTEHHQQNGAVNILFYTLVASVFFKHNIKKMSQKDTILSKKQSFF